MIKYSLHEHSMGLAKKKKTGFAGKGRREGEERR